mmetsp:Transcript_17524/g.38199  ORF Transcript_17524/g.38199 Transcript_17524/m.38199 type:complete len:207 (+) Transcript_17524:996-1616(+)
MHACSAWHPRRFGAALDEVSEEEFCLIECFNDALAHLRMSRAILPQYTVIRTYTIKVPIKPHYGTHVRNSILKNGTHIPYRHTIGYRHTPSFGSIPHHAQVQCRLVSDPTNIDNVFYLNQYHTQLHVCDRIEDTFNRGSAAIASLQNSLDDLYAVFTGDAVDGHAELDVFGDRVAIGGDHHDWRDVRITILGWIDVVDLGGQFVHR